jgi:uncharacterized protein
VAALQAELGGLPGAIVAFSGGVDSTMLLHAAREALGARVVAVTADSPSLPRAELQDACALARVLGVRHEILATAELERDEYRRNGADRCYFCKNELFDAIAARMAELVPEPWPVLYGAIADDAGDHRPGAAAATERGVLAPIRAFTKEEVRRYSREHRLPTADKPSLACLASRVPYGTAIDAAMLATIEAAERALHALGYRQVRVRHHGAVARIEIPEAEFDRALRERAAIVDGVRAAGYRYVALDLSGYRSGAMNEVLGAGERTSAD